MQKISLTFPNYFDDEFVEEFKSTKLGEYEIEIGKYPELPKEIGGMGLYVAISLATTVGVAVMKGFLEELGKDIYKKFKEKLFQSKSKLGNGNLDRFEIHMNIDEYLSVSFDLTDLPQLDFYLALNSINHTVDSIVPHLKGMCIVYFKYNIIDKRWFLDSISER